MRLLLGRDMRWSFLSWWGWLRGRARGAGPGWRPRQVKGRSAVRVAPVADVAADGADHQERHAEHAAVVVPGRGRAVADVELHRPGAAPEGIHAGEDAGRARAAVVGLHLADPGQ